MVNNPNVAGHRRTYAASFVKLNYSEMRRVPWPSRTILQDGRRVKLTTPVSTTNPFIDPEGYRVFLDGFEKQYQQQLAQERNAR